MADDLDERPGGLTPGPKICFIGFGELARAWSRDLETADVGELRAFVRRKPTVTDADTNGSLGAVRLCYSLKTALQGADVVIAAVPGLANLDAALACSSEIGPEVLYVDVSSAAPQRKVDAAAAVDRSGARYVDVAVMGSAASAGISVPVMASGPGAMAWAQAFTPFGARVTVLPGGVGDAARLKLLRSVYLKGRDALLLELLVAVARYGVEDVVLQSMPNQSAAESFEGLVARTMKALDAHAPRRAEELVDASVVLKAVGVDPIMTLAAAERLRRFVDDRADVAHWLGQ